ncbi:MAG: hypothetical protein AABY11_00100 [archaeon]
MGFIEQLKKMLGPSPHSSRGKTPKKGKKTAELCVHCDNLLKTKKEKQTSVCTACQMERF